MDINLKTRLAAYNPENLRVEFFFSSRRRHTSVKCDWSSDVCSSDLLVDEQPRRRDLRGHIGELCLDRLELGDRLAERPALLGVLQRLVECALRETDAHRGDTDPPDVEDVQELLEAGP